MITQIVQFETELDTALKLRIPMSVNRANYSVAVMLVTTLFWLLYDGELLILVTESIMLMSFPV